MIIFNPIYALTNNVLINVRLIGILIGDLNSRLVPTQTYIRFEREARCLSSYSSTKIEGNPLPLTVVKKLIKQNPVSKKTNEIEILNYNRALKFLHKQIKSQTRLKLTTKFICDVHAIVVKSLLLREKGYRTEPVIVNDPATGHVIYYPPDHKDVVKLMDELLQFVNANVGCIDPLLLAAIFHKRFVIIHPFVDGNGRTARLITTFILAKLGLNMFNIFSFENFYNKNLSEYFGYIGVLGDYYDLKDQIDYTEWIDFFTEGIIDELTRVKTLISTGFNRLGSHLRKLLDYISEYGSISSSEYAKLSRRKRSTRINDFKKLVALGLIKRIGEKKGAYYVLANSTTAS
ncbi:Fic family protein [Candidatus Dojkabacteria bacterium]|nr:Fic family protein [Candidatus Dojkabacteria bacterium]